MPSHAPIAAFGDAADAIHLPGLIQTLEEKAREDFRGQLTAVCNLYSFLSQIMPYTDEELERV